MSVLKNKWFIIAAVLVVAALFAAFSLNRKEKPQYFTAKVEHGDVRDVVEVRTARGTVTARVNPRAMRGDYQHASGSTPPDDLVNRRLRCRPTAPAVSPTRGERFNEQCPVEL